jgi:hypothetical protein
VELQLKASNSLLVGCGHLLRHFIHNFLQRFTGFFDLPEAAIQ